MTTRGEARQTRRGLWAIGAVAVGTLVAAVTGTAGTAERQVSGIIRGTRELTVKARSQGLLTKIQVQEGQAVKIGDLLAVVDDEQEVLEEKLAAIEAATARTEAQSAGKLAAYVAKDEIDKKSTELKRREIALDLKRYMLKLARIDSPIDGVVTRAYVEVGETISVGEKAFDVVNLERIAIEFDVPAPAATQLAGTKTVEFLAKLSGSTRFSGVVTYVSPVLEASSGTVRMRVEADNPLGASGYALKPGDVATLVLGEGVVSH